MRLSDIITSAFKEIRLGYKLLIPAFIATSVMIAVAIILLNISSSSMDVIYAQFDNTFNDGMNVTIDNAEFDDLETLESIGIKNMSLLCNSETIYNATVKTNGGTPMPSQEDDFFYLLCPFWYNESNSDEYLKSFGVTDEDNSSDNAYILCPIEQYEYWSGVDTVEIYDRENQVCTFNLKKIICDDEVYNSRIYIPFEKIYEVYKEDGIYLSHEISCLVKPVSDYAAVKQKLLDNGFKISSQIDDLSDNTAMLDVFFKAMSAVIIILGILSLVTMCNMYFKSRNNHIILEKTLGMTSKGVFAILFVIIEIVLIVSSFMAIIIVFFGNNYIYSVLAEVFGKFDYSVSNTFFAALIAFVVSNIAALVSSIGIYRKIRRTDIVSVLGNNE